MKLKVTVDGKVYEVEVEVAPEPPQVLPTFMVQSAAAAMPAAGAGAATSGGGEAGAWMRRKYAAARFRGSW